MTRNQCSIFEKSHNSIEDTAHLWADHQTDRTNAYSRIIPLNIMAFEGKQEIFF